MSGKKKNGSTVILIICIILAVLGAGYFVVGDLFDVVKEAPEMLVEDPAVSDIIEISKDTAEIFTSFGNYVGEIKTPSLSDIEKYASEYEIESGNSEIPSNSSNETVVTEYGEVIRVVDGDTYMLNINGTETRVRLIGVDTPESVAPDSYYKENSEEGVAVSDIVKEKIKAGDVLYIEYDVGKTDSYGRTLAYLYFEDGTMVQDWLLSNGYAQVMTIQPNSKYADHFVAVEQQAMNNGVGLWNGAFSE